MAGRKRDVTIDFIVDDKQKSKLRGIGDEAGKAQSRFSQLSGGMKTAAVAAAAFVATKIADALFDAAKAAAEDEKSQRLLALALENAAGATQGQIDQTEVWIDTMSRTKGVADDELRPALANLVRANGDVKQSQEELNIALDIAAARGLSVETVSLAMAKASQGNVGALGRMGIAVKDADGKLLSYEEVLENASELMGGAASEAAETLEGRMKRMQISFDEAKEELGANLIPVLETGARTLNFFLAQFSGQEGSVAIERMQAALSQLVDDGVDPFENRMKSATTVLLTANEQAEITTQSVEQLKTMFELTGPEILTMLDYVKANSEALGLNGTELDEVTHSLSESYNNWLHNRDAIGQHTGVIEEDTEATDAEMSAQKKLNDQVRIGTDLFVDAHDKIRSASDAMFNLSEKTDAAAVAQAAVNTAAEKFGTDSPEYLQAVRDAAGANQAVDDALRDIVAAGGMTRDEFIKQQIALGLTKDQASLLADELERIGAFHPTPINFVVTVNGKKVAVDSRGTIGFGTGGEGLTGQASGGPVSAGRSYVVGEQGPELITMGGNGYVTPNHALGGGSTYALTVNAGMGANGSQIGKLIVEEIRQYEKRNGRGWRS